MTAESPIATTYGDGRHHERETVLTNPHQIMASLMMRHFEPDLTQVTEERFVMARLQSQTSAGKVLRISQTPDMEIRIRTEISNEPGTVIDALVNTIYILRGNAEAAKLQRFSHEGQWFFSSLDNSTATSESEVYRVPLEFLKTMTDDELLDRVENHYAVFQEFANAWPHNEDLVLNDHGQRHLKVVITKLDRLQTLFQNSSHTNRSELDSEEKRAQLVAAIFHDIGMALGGRANHAELSIEALKLGQLVGDWDSSDAFCARVEHLIRYHCTAAVEKDLDIIRVDPGLAKVILADELDLADRQLSTYLMTDARSYIEDPWIRIATHVSSTEIEKVVLPSGEVFMLFAIGCDETQLKVKQLEIKAQYQLENQGRAAVLHDQSLGMIETLNQVIFSKKYAVYASCAAALIGTGTKIGVRFNQDRQFYEVGTAGILSDKRGDYPN